MNLRLDHVVIAVAVADLDRATEDCRALALRTASGTGSLSFDRGLDRDLLLED